MISMPLNRTAGSLLENIMDGVGKPLKRPDKIREAPARKIPDKKPVTVKQERKSLPGKKKANSSLSFIHTREKRDGVLYLRVSALTRERLDYLCKESHSSQATVIESLIEAAVEGKVSC